MKVKTMAVIAFGSLLFACNNPEPGKVEEKGFKYQVDQFADCKILRYQVPGFDSLSLQQKELVYYLSQAALCGRDILFDQNYKENLTIRRTLEAIYAGYSGDRTTNDFKAFEIYLKRVWFSNGIHHHYSNDKFFPEISKEYFASLIDKTEKASWPLKDNNESLDAFKTRLIDLIFNPNIASKRLEQSEGTDMILASASNFYEGVTQKEVEEYYDAMRKPQDPQPISYGLNSKVVKENGKVIEHKWFSGGMYGAAIEKIIYWLDKASTVAETESQKAMILKLIEYYKTGDLKTWDDFNVMWVEDNSMVDFVNGFIEVYSDPMGIKATWEVVVNFKDIEATHRAEKISSAAQWFEDNSPVDSKFKKAVVKGVSAKVITVAQLGGDCYPTTPIGINLPNANWIRKDHGSKSVTMENITYAYDQASSGSGMLEEFCYSEDEIKRAKEFGPLAGNLHTDLHECLGHGSGQLLPGVTPEKLKNYHSPIEEARADLFALYYLADPKMIELGLIPSVDVAWAEYDGYIRNGMMTQLTRIELGKSIEQAHMRNRALIAHWCYEKGAAQNIIEKKTRDNKTFYVINDYEKLRGLFGELLKEIQRITSEGDFNAAKNLVETYAVKIDPTLHKEVIDRYASLKLAPYGGFMNPTFVPVEKDGKIVDVKVEYPDNYIEQMIKYSKEYSFLPNYN
jgi:dipeptidyl-peptidase-3